MSNTEGRETCTSLKFKDFEFNEQSHLITRLTEKAPKLKKGDRVTLISSCGTKSESATIMDVLNIPFAELATTHRKYLDMQHNKNCRTYESLKICMSNYYNKDIEKEPVSLFIFKLGKHMGLFDEVAS